MNHCLSKFLVMIAWFSIHSYCCAQQKPAADDHWPQFRGYHASGIGSGSPPVTWDVETGANIAWKTPIEGLAHSSPVVWGDRVFLTTAISSKSEEPELGTGWLGGTGKALDEETEWTWQVICLQLSTGNVLWKQDAARGRPIIKRHIKASHANCTPATDGSRVVAFFGSEGLFCLSIDGELQWKRDLGRLHSGPYDAEELEWGFASSPVIHDDKVIVQCDCLNTNFVAIFDLVTGEELRRIERDDVATWSTPGVFTIGGQTQIVCNGFRQMAGYDLDSGQPLWTLSGGGDVPVPTPLFANDLIYITNSHKRSPTYAISPAATGDITPEKDTEEFPEGLVWWQPRDGSYMPTPIIVGDRLYTCNDNGTLAVRDAGTGKLIYKERVGSGKTTFSASAVSAGDRLYFSAENGDVYVVKLGDEFEALATNEMKETLMATPAISGNRLLVRTVNHLYCIESSGD